jgi:molybdenum cofactor synthesis domain-containing protein
VRTATLLIVGDEILSGEVVDENGPYLLKRFAQAGVKVERVAVAPDAEGPIAEELLRLRALGDAVIVSGGIGPTHDDVTRPAVSRVLGLPLESHPAAEGRIRAFYRERVTEAELSMALWPQGAQCVVGQKTGTIGFACCGVYVLPGVPVLFRDLVDSIATEFAAPPLHRQELVTRRREGEIALGLAECQGRACDVRIGSYPVLEETGWHVRVVLRGVDPARVEAVAREVMAHLV